MRTSSRYERHIEKINFFLNNQSQTSLGLLLYKSEISRLRRDFTEIIIEESENCKDSSLIRCTILKK